MNCIFDIHFYDVISDFISRVREDPDRITTLNCPDSQQLAVQRWIQKTELEHEVGNFVLRKGVLRHSR